MSRKKEGHKYYHFLITRNISDPHKSVVCKDCGVEVFASAKTLKANSKQVVIGICPSCNSSVSAREYELTVADRDGDFEGRKFTCVCGLTLMAESFDPIVLTEFIEPIDEDRENESGEEDIE